MKYVAFNLDKLRAILDSRNLKERDLAKMMYGPKTHQTFQTIFTKSFGVQKLLDICNALNIPIDCLFDIESEENEKIPVIKGNNNNVNSTVIHNDYTSLQYENDSLRKLINEKDKRISDLQKSLDILNAILQDKNRTNNKKND